MEITVYSPDARSRRRAVRMEPTRTLSHPFVERLVSTIRRECLDRGAASARGEPPILSMEISLPGLVSNTDRCLIFPWTRVATVWPGMAQVRF
jgi:hypothetical protein